MAAQQPHTTPTSAPSVSALTDVADAHAALVALLSPGAEVPGIAERVRRFLTEDNWVRALALWAADRPGLKADPTRDKLGQLLSRDIALIDQALTDQVNAILHHPSFQKLESSWRGLQYVVERAAEDPARSVRVRALDARWKELARDAERAVEFDQTALFQKIYEDEFGTAGGEPFGVLIGDYEISHRPGPDHPIDDLDVLASISQAAAAAFAPFITGAHPALLGLDHFGQLERHIDLDRVFQGADYAKWHALRRAEDSRFVGITLPHMLMRRPYERSEATVTRRFCTQCNADLRGIYDEMCPKCRHPFRLDDPETYRSEHLGFRYSEDADGADRSKYLFGNAAFAFAGVLIRAFIDCGWLADIRGFDRNLDQGGIVTGLPVHDFGLDAPGVAPKMCTDVVVNDFQEKGVSDQGLIPLSRCHDTEFSVFYSNRSLHRPQTYTDDSATLNARISSMLQYTLCISRFAHYLKVQARDQLGSTVDVTGLEDRLRDWAHKYVTQDDHAAPDVKARYPLREADVQVREVPGRPGTHQLMLKLWPHYQLDDLLVSVRMVTKLDGVRPR